MSPNELQAVLEQVRAGTLPVESAARQLGEAGVADLGYATLDLNRRDRCGFPEVIFAEGKTGEWVEGAVRRLAAAGQDFSASPSRPTISPSNFLRPNRSPGAEFWLPAARR